MTQYSEAKRAWWAVCSLLVLTVGFGELTFAQSGDYTFRLSTAFVPQNSVADVGVTFEHSGATPIAGWSMAICHQAPLEVLSVRAGQATLGLVPDLLIQDVQGPGWVAGVVISFFGLRQLSGGLHDVHHAYYWVPEPGVHPLEFCAIGNVDPRVNEFLAPESVIPSLVGGDIAAVPSSLPRFLRGDCNNDGTIDTLDGLQLVLYLFGNGPFPGSCVESCNANGEGSVAPVDALLILNYLFLGGRAPAAPFPFCGSVAGSPCVVGFCP